MNTDTTITDKKNFKINIVDKKKFSKLNLEDQKLFEQLRNSIIEIFPFEKNEFHPLSIQYAENFAFLQVKAINSILEGRLEERILEFEQIINNKINELNTSFNLFNNHIKNSINA